MLKNRNDSIELSVIIPIYNEEANIPELVSRLKNTLLLLGIDYELIFVNDGSKDHSLEVLIKLTQEDSRIFYINLSRNFGHQLAVTAGLDACKGEAVVIIDADLQDPPELIEKLYRKYQEGYNVVYAKRISRSGDSLFKRLSAFIFYRLMKSISAINIPLDVGDYRLIDRRIVDLLCKMPEQNKFLRGQIAWLGFNQTSIEFERQQRKDGQTGYTFSKMLQLAFDAITGFSDKPLSFVMRLGFFISGISFIVILYALYSHYFLKRTITGWTSLIISSMFIGGVQLISIGIIGEYISRINKNVQGRPLYIIQDTNISSSKI
ncbi:MAG: glycosyltransferase family 2 protein [Saprospiraceae bacterium]